MFAGVLYGFKEYLSFSYESLIRLENWRHQSLKRLSTQETNSKINYFTRIVASRPIKACPARNMSRVSFRNVPQMWRGAGSATVIYRSLSLFIKLPNDAN